MVKTQKQKNIAKPAAAFGSKLLPGNLVTLKITALGPNNVGMNEYSYAMPVLVPNAKLGETIQAQILKITKYNVAIAKLVRVLKSSPSQKSASSKIGANAKAVLKPGDNIECSINKIRAKGKFDQHNTGIIEVPNVYQNVKKVFVSLPTSSNYLRVSAGEKEDTLRDTKVNVTITRIKDNYAFGVINTSELKADQKNQPLPSKGTIETQKKGATVQMLDVFKGSKFTLTLPTRKLGAKTKGSTLLKHFVFKLNSLGQSYKANNLETLIAQPLVNSGQKPNRDFLSLSMTRSNGNMTGSQTRAEAQPLRVQKKKKLLPPNTILFVKPRLGAKAGQKVQICITKFIFANPGDLGTNSGSLKYNIAFAKIIKLNPVSLKSKKALVRASLRQMSLSGMHYGEQAIKCNARMKNYVWIRKKGQNINKPLIKKGRNIINLLKTRRCLQKALAQLSKYAAKGKTFLFVGTKKAAAGLVARASLFSKKAFFVNTRWLGGMLTNWKTIVKSISKIRPILKEKQLIIRDILEKRKNIRATLVQKALLLRKKSKLMLKKGRQAITILREFMRKNGYTAPDIIKRTNLLNTRRKDLIAKGVLTLKKQRQLVLKRQELMAQSQKLLAKAKGLSNTYLQLSLQLANSRKKLRELKSLLIISKELQAFKQQSRDQNQNLYMVSYNKFRALSPTPYGALRENAAAQSFILANPPREILNKMVSIIKGQGLIIREKKLAFDSNLNLKTAASTPRDMASNKTLIISQLASKFSLFVPTIISSIQNLQTYTKTLLNSMAVVKTLLNTVKTKMSWYLDLKNKIVFELRQMKQTLQTERSIIRVLKRKLKQIYSHQRLINFLPKLRYLPTPTSKIEQTARFLMKKFVDPKMKYPMDSIYDEKLSRQSKKVLASRKKKWQRLEKYLGGISNMTKIKEKHIRNNVAIIIGQQEEMNAVRECQKLGIKMFHIVDTNCNPGFADHFIPANDDARNSIKFILAKFLTRIRLAQKLKKNFRKKANLNRK